MSDIITPLLTTTDWNDEWKRLQAAREHADSAAVWNEKAKTFPVKHGSQDGYAGQFLQLAAIEPGESVLDMGCGTGVLATPLARDGHRVIACDFSQGMLDVMTADMQSLGVTSAETHLLSWSDDWDAHGIGEDCVDVALASRSIATYDLKEALMKLDRVARRRVCITLPASLSPKADDELLAAAGLPAPVGIDFRYAFNILASLGNRPEVSYITSSRLEVFPSYDAARETFCKIALSAMRGLAEDGQLDEVPSRLSAWLDDNLVEDEQGVHLQRPREVKWAFLAWSPR